MDKINEFDQLDQVVGGVCEEDLDIISRKNSEITCKFCGGKMRGGSSGIKIKQGGAYICSCGAKYIIGASEPWIAPPNNFMA